MMRYILALTLMFGFQLNAQANTVICNHYKKSGPYLVLGKTFPPLCEYCQLTSAVPGNPEMEETFKNLPGAGRICLEGNYGYRNGSRIFLANKVVE